MKKAILILIFCLLMAKTSFAQNNVEGMRFLTINALMQYGQKLYDRGDFNGATAVFDHVLIYDGHQAQALRYLKEMGHSPSPMTGLTARSTLDTLDTRSLAQAIEAKKQSIEKLRAQIKQLRAHIASQLN